MFRWMRVRRKFDLILFITFLVLYLTVSMAIVTKYGTTVVWDYTEFSHDNSAHLYIAAAIINNGRESKFSNVGTVWLPLFHLVLAPFVKIGFLYKTGLAGSIVNSFLVAGSALILYRMFRGTTGILVSILYGLNTYSIIHASSSYMIPLGQFLSLLSVYYLSDYLKTGSGRFLTKAVILLMFSTLSRYETWPMVLVLIIILCLKEIREGRTYRIFSYVPLLMAGEGWWLLYNWAIFGGPLQFVTHSSPGASGYYFKVISKLLHPLTIDVKAVVVVLWKLVGPSVVFTIAGIFVMVMRKKFCLLSVVLSGIILLLAEGPWIPIRNHPLYYYFSLPYLLIPIGFLVEEVLERSKRVGLFLVILMLLTSIPYLVGGIKGALHSLDQGYSTMNMYTNLSDTILSHRGSGYIMYSSIIGSYYFSAATGLPPKCILDEYDDPLFLNASQAPWRHNVSIVVIPVKRGYERVHSYLNGLDRGKDYISRYYEDKMWHEKFLRHYRPLNEKPLDFYGFRIMIFVESYHLR